MTKKAAPIDLSDSFEKIPVKIFSTPKDGSAFVARQVADFIRDKQKRKEKCVLGLATGSTPKSLYTELVRMHGPSYLSPGDLQAGQESRTARRPVEPVGDLSGAAFRARTRNTAWNASSASSPRGGAPRERTRPRRGD